MGQLFIDFLAQVLFTVGVIFLCGLIISLCNRIFYANFGSHAMMVGYVTGFLGTPVHELSHALFCVIFRHKILKVKLFQIGEDGTLGYVSHSYNPRSLYQQIGNFFIGIAPIVVISCILYVAAYFLLPSFTETLFTVFADSASLDASAVWGGLWLALKTFFGLITTWQWWVFLLIGLLLCLHMTLSLQDIKGALHGLVFLLLILLAVDFVLFFVGGTLLSDFTEIMISIGYYLVCIFALAIFLSLIEVAVSFLFRPFFGRR